jgi:LuxR family maltose regulon positive regulatory protein
MLSQAEQWVADNQLDRHTDVSYTTELKLITLARVLIAQKKLIESQELLYRLASTAEAGGRNGRLIEILVLLSLALQANSRVSQAIEILSKCLKLAEPEGYARIFLDEGQPMQMLLAQWLAHADPDPLRDYAIRLLSQFEAEPKEIKATQDKAPPGGDLIEPLSQRELEVLHLIALGNTNQEIAAQLIVAPGTVKAHTASIYRKLDVANRTEAVARARQLGMLP